MIALKGIRWVEGSAMTGDLLAMTADNEMVDLAIFDILRIGKIDLKDSRAVIVLLGCFVDNDIQYPICFCRSWEDGKNILTQIAENVMMRHRFADLRAATFQPEQAIMDEIQNASVGTDQAAVPVEPVDREKRRVFSSQMGKNPVYKEAAKVEQAKQ